MKHLLRSTTYILLALVAVLGLSGHEAVFADSGAEHQLTQAFPILLGTSGGNIFDSSKRFCCSGTAGSLVQDTAGNQYILSNNHVLARLNSGSPGEGVSHPGLIDQNCQTNGVIAELTTFETIITGSRKNPGGPNLVDAAIARVTLGGSVAADGAILDIGPIAGTVAAQVGMAVQKSGRTSGHTTASISAVGVEVNVAYSAECGGRSNLVAHYIGQILVNSSGFSEGGDSGSLIVEDLDPYPNLPRAVGLLFAGSSSTTLLNPIGDVLSALGNQLGSTLTMVAGTPTAPPASGSISGTVLDSLGAAISGATVTVTGTGDTGSTDALGDYTIGGVSVGNHDVVASASGFVTSGSQNVDVAADTDTAGVDFALVAAPNAMQSMVACIGYDTNGGKRKDRNLLITVSVVDDFGQLIAGAAVDISVTLNGSVWGTGTGAITNEQGQVTFNARNASNGVYETTITDVRSGALNFDTNSTPANQFTKGTDSATSFCNAGSSLSTSGPQGAAVERAKGAKARNSQRLFNIPGVVGHGVGLGANGEPVIQVYLANSSAEANRQIPAAIEGFGVEVIVTGEFVAY